MPNPSDSVAHMAPEQQAINCHPMSAHAAAAYTPESQSILASSGSTSSDSAQAILPSCSIDFTSGGAGGDGGSSESVTIKGSALGGETINITSDQPFNLNININDGQPGSAAGDVAVAGGTDAQSGAVVDRQAAAGTDAGVAAVDTSSGNFGDSQMQQIELMFKNLQDSLDNFGATHGLPRGPEVRPFSGADQGTNMPSNDASTNPLSQAIEASANENLPPGSARVLGSLDPTNPRSLADPENQGNPINALTNKSNPNNPETFTYNVVNHPDRAAKTILNDVKDIWHSIF